MKKYYTLSMLLFFFSFNSNAKNENSIINRNDLWNLHAHLGFMIGKINSALDAGAGFKYIVPKKFYQINYNFGEGIVFSPTLYHEITVGIGKHFTVNSTSGDLSINAGYLINCRRNYGDVIDNNSWFCPDYKIDTFNTPCISLKADVNLNSKYTNIGFYSSINLNALMPYFTFGLGIGIGKLK